MHAGHMPLPGVSERAEEGRFFYGSELLALNSVTLAHHVQTPYTEVTASPFLM